jgi:hypothetical protein
MQNHSLKAGDKNLGIELMLIPEKNPVIHGQNGISQKAEGEDRGESQDHLGT